ncbi:2-C-methyl-D-erythritol 4-phosphate cytidylyltransferase [Mucilaginibacter ginsenosidivorans]|uniref:2-C-methyl-D-erythritol 4-phosphate cytidylyltransferase n=1 Tax=Mucilaginibacter ginsenosidivorans TaxID=398053 RepID=A0A5B8V0T5_9SPHI|nr:2-C-methyl-D-erythritol 4-phosphate cytidylyltransferase [Mucilaginibacter ginsenosidivorans]QEC64819.1 2-C-methyl-D-erythritol 4-phosphate cytidylyltransferase [Mucilaginibacter ginsenosidivorans]
MSDPNLTSQIQNPKSKHYAIIVAGGSGTRMRSSVPKQYLLLNGIPLLMHTINAFNACATKPGIILVLHPESHDYWNQLCKEHNFTVPHQLVSGGETRFHSVRNGINMIEDDDAIVAIHDAVRPLVTCAIIDESYECAEKYGNAIVAVKSRDSVRQIRDNRSQSLNRDNIYLIQTPQTFQAAQLKNAYKQVYQESFTDDASVVEQTGVNINLIGGSHQNIKITFPEDIAIAEFLLKQ